MNLKEFKAQRGISNKELANAMGVSIPTVKRRIEQPQTLLAHEVIKLIVCYQLNDEETRKLLES